METAFGEAIGLADNGFRIPGRLADAIASNASNLALDANAWRPISTQMDLHGKSARP